MRTILLIEADALLRDLVSDHLQREGFTACAVATPQIALAAARSTRFDLILLDVGAAARSEREQLAALRALDAPVVLTRVAPAGLASVGEGETTQVVWSPFDPATVTAVVRRFFPPEVDAPPEPMRVSSGTFAVSRPLETAPALDGSEPATLDSLSALVLQSTGRR